MKIEFLDGKVQEFQEACNMFVIAKSISNSLAKKAVAAKIDGELYDMSYILDHDAKVEFIMPESEEGVEVIRHSAAHLDRKSTRLNSSHANISYAVFCLKKK